MNRPLVGITTDIDPADGRRFVRPAYAQRVAEAGGLPIILAPDIQLIDDYRSRCDAFILTGGDDPIMEQWGAPTHPKATKVHPERHAFEIALLEALDDRPEIPVLGICLGMQYMALRAGGAIDQHLPDSRPEIASRHWGKVEHGVELLNRQSSIVNRQSVLSHHRQAIVDPGSLDVCARCVDDDLIEGVCDPQRAFYLGVQWHPERTHDERGGIGLFRALVECAGPVETGAQGF